MTFSRLASLFTFSFALAATASAATISGTVSDRTTNRVAAGDAVVLIGFGQGMQEVARTTTDAHGHYSIQVPDDAAAGATGSTHLIRVDHQKATYFQPAPAGAATVDVDVYDVRDTVKGISTEADVLNMQTDQGGLHVVENYFVRNDSKPAMTQLSRKAYEIYLPSGAKIEASAAMGPGGMPVASSPLPVGDPNHYAFVFPVRPGETRFQISYEVPYSGSLQFSQKEALPTENLVVMLPKSMQFTPGSSNFQPVPDNVAAQTFVLKGVAPTQPAGFTVAGSGSMPREVQGQDGGATGQAAAANGQGSPTAAQPEAAGAPATNPAAGPDNRPGGGLGPPIDTPDPLNKYKWLILSGLALVLVVAAAWLLKKPRTADGGRAAQAPPTHPALTPTLPITPPRAGAAPTGSLLDALKEALFALEAERLGGHMSDADYREIKSSLEVVLRQALERVAKTAR